MQWFATNIYTRRILNYPFLSELKLYTAETYLPRINFIILTRVWLKIHVSIFLWVVKTSQDFHRTDMTESLPPYPILICTTFGISAENFMLLSTDARFLQFQQLMECTKKVAMHSVTVCVWKRILSLPHSPPLSVPSAFRPSAPSASGFGALIPRCVQWKIFFKLRPDSGWPSGVFCGLLQASAADALSKTAVSAKDYADKAPEEQVVDITRSK